MVVIHRIGRNTPEKNCKQFYSSGPNETQEVSEKIYDLARAMTARTGATRCFLVLFGLHLKATVKHRNTFTFLEFVSPVESKNIVCDFICV
jgi:hypothetical protein